VTSPLISAWSDKPPHPKPLSKFSRIGGILDPYGGLRFIVARKYQFRAHVRCDELLFVVPGVKVVEPVPWEQIPWVISRITQHINEWISTRNDPDVLELTPIKMYLIRSRKTDHGRATNLDAVMMG
jgi:hypothetical protein